MRAALFEVAVAVISPGDAAMTEARLSGSSLMIAAETAAFGEFGHNPQPMLVRLTQAGAIVIPGKVIS